MIRTACVLSLAALLCGSTPRASAQAQQQQQQVVAPGDNLVAQGVPPIPASLADTVGRYTDFRAAVFTGWHPTRREVLINTRFADTAQVHHVKTPLGARTQLTFYKEPARGGSFRLAGAQAPVLSVIHATNLDRLLPLHPTVGEAVRAALSAG